MSHKTKKLTWYSLYSRIGKMRVADSKNRVVMAEVNGKLYPVELQYSESGEIATLKINTEKDNPAS